MLKWLLLMSAFIPAVATAQEKIRLPDRLSSVAARDGVEHVVIITEYAEQDGIFDTQPDSYLHISKTLLDFASSSEERDALIAIVLSYKIGHSQSPRRQSRAGKVLSVLVASYIEEEIEERDRRDPYLRLPSSPRGQGRHQVPSAQSYDQRAVRALTWAQNAGVCEAVTIALLDRLAGFRENYPGIAGDADSVRTGLGMLRFAPPTECPAR